MKNSLFWDMQSFMQRAGINEVMKYGKIIVVL